MAQDRDDSMRDETTPEDLRRRVDDTTEAVRIIGDDADEPPLRFAEDVTGELPHWTSPPTGEAPKLFSEASTDDLEAWSTFASQPVWRDDKADATMDDLGDLRAQLGGPAPREERTATARPVDRASDDLFAGLEPVRDRGTTAGPEVDAEPAVIAIGGADPRVRAGETGPVPRAAAPRQQTAHARSAGEADPFTPTRGTGGRNMGQALGVGLAIAAVALVAFRMGPQVTLGLITVIMALCAVEFFTAVRESGHHHAATPVGLVAVTAAPVAAYLRGESGLVLVGALGIVGTVLWFMTADRRPGVVAGAGATLLGIGWIGILGGFAGLLLTFPNDTDHILAIALVVVAYDAVALLAGSSLGRTPLAPSISPNKTWEGTIVGVLVAILVSVGITGTQLAPWAENWLHPLQLGLIGGVAAVLGDLASSVLKRDMGVKDWGTLLPGHGGALDRFSGFLFALPVAYYLCRVLNVY